MTNQMKIGIKILKINQNMKKNSSRFSSDLQNKDYRMCIGSMYLSIMYFYCSYLLFNYGMGN